MACSWDETKRRINRVKHGIDFVDACRIFEGPTIEAPDARRDYGEVRIGAYGAVDQIVLFVVYVWRAGKRRLISARRAGSDERKRFHAAIATASQGRH